jgi:hypothetical protein
MPRLTKKRAARKPVWTELHVDALKTGFDFFQPFGHTTEQRFCDPAVEEMRRMAWADLGEAIMAEWTVAHPFTRPDAWWHFDAPERRQRIDGGIHPHDDPAWPASLPKVLWLGRPAYVAVVRSDFKAKYESEFDYLCRLALTTDHERHLIAHPAPGVDGDGQPSPDATEV